jgi:hydrogenase/urease accessory protein HupE
VKIRCIAWVVALVGLFSANAGAHSLPLSYSFWIATPSGIDVTLQMTLPELASLGFDLETNPERSDEAGVRLQQLLEMRVGDVPCTPASLPVRPAAASPWVIYRWTLTCTGSGERVVSARLGSVLEAGGRHLLCWDDGRGPVDVVLDASKTSVGLGRGGGAPGTAFFDYLALGVEHLLTGWDHMVFVLALVLLARRIREVVALVTSFTVAHSITLALAVLHVVTPDPRPVEALIGFSIALLGAENAWLLSGRSMRIPLIVVSALTVLSFFERGAVSRSALTGLAVFSASHFGLLSRSARPAPLRVVLAFGFGLIHGFGFAGVMAELALPAHRLVPALLGFNLGVEVGQLGVVLLTWPLLRFLERAAKGRWFALTTEAISAAVCGVGVYWFATRL